MTGRFEVTTNYFPISKVMTFTPEVMTYLLSKRLYTRIVMTYRIFQCIDKPIKRFYGRLVMTFEAKKRLDILKVMTFESKK